MPRGPWKLSKCKGTIRHRKSSIQSLYWQRTKGRKSYLWYKNFSFTKYQSKDEAFAAAKAYHIRKNIEHKVGWNLWRECNPNHVEIQLSKNLTTIMDRESWELFRGKHALRAHKVECSGGWYVVNSKLGRVHVIINETPANMETHHIDLDGLHNCRSNLRSVTHTENMNSTRLRSDNRTGVVGVSLSRKYGSTLGWQVSYTDDTNQRRCKQFRFRADESILQIPVRVLNFNAKKRMQMKRRHGHL